jgi:hypothetical protein
MNAHYVFGTEQEAINAELQIRQLGNFPLQGINAATGQPEPKGLTTAWAMPQERLDGKWVFPRVPKNLCNQYPGAIEQFIANHTFTVEDYSPDWFPLTALEV